MTISSPLAPLTEVHQIFVAAGPDPWLAYPLLHHFLLTGAYAPYLLWLILTGQFHATGADYPYGLADPVSALRVLHADRPARDARHGYRRLGSSPLESARPSRTRRPAPWPALSPFVPYPMFYYSKTANLEIPVLFWISLLALLCLQPASHRGIQRVASRRARDLRRSRHRHQGSGGRSVRAAARGPPLHRWRDPERPRLPWWQPPLALLAPGAIAYAVGSGLALDPARYVAHVGWVLNKNPVIHAAVIRPPTLAGAASLTAEILATVSWLLGPGLSVASLLAMLHAACVPPPRAGPRRPRARLRALHPRARALLQDPVRDAPGPRPRQCLAARGTALAPRRLAGLSSGRPRHHAPRLRLAPVLQRGSGVPDAQRLPLSRRGLARRDDAAGRPPRLLRDGQQFAESETRTAAGSHPPGTRLRAIPRGAPPGCGGGHSRLDQPARRAAQRLVLGRPTSACTLDRWATRWPPPSRRPPWCSGSSSTIRASIPPCISSSGASAGQRGEPALTDEESDEPAGRGTDITPSGPRPAPGGSPSPPLPGDRAGWSGRCRSP